jgi:hypothetical protein
MDQRFIISEYVNRDKANFKSTRKLFGVDRSQKYAAQAYELIRKHMAIVYAGTGFVGRIL